MAGSPTASIRRWSVPAIPSPRSPSASAARRLPISRSARRTWTRRRSQRSASTPWSAAKPPRRRRRLGGRAIRANISRLFSIVWMIRSLVASRTPDANICRSPSKLRACRRFAPFARALQCHRRHGVDGGIARDRDRGRAQATSFVIEDRMIRNCRGSAPPRFIGRALAALGALPAAALAAPAWNFQTPVTPIAREQFDLHLYIFWICVVIFIGVFGVLFYSLLKHRKSVGHQAAQFHENTTVEVVWTVIPFLILVFMAYPASKTILALKDTSAPDMTIKVTGYQWKWNYDYIEDGFGFYSTLATPFDQIENRAPKDENYLLEVDHPLVVPVDTKVRVLITAGDVIHSWWVPAFGVKQDAIPGFVRDTWFKADKVG